MKKEPGLALEKRCSVTAFDLRLQLHHDGGGNQPPGTGRGVWFNLRDTSKARSKNYEEWFKSTTDRLIADHPDVGYAAALSLTEMRPLLRTDVNESVLMEWDDLEEIHETIGKILETRRKIRALTKSMPLKP